jgi:hypothetical protein
LPERARRDHITSKLTYGDLDPRTANELIRTARDLANEIIRSSVPKSVAPQSVEFGPIDPPPYTASLIGLVDRALARPNLYLSMPQHLDFLLFEQGLKGKEYSEQELLRVFGYNLSDERFKVARNILSFVRESCGLDWRSMWGKGDSAKPDQPSLIKPNEVVTSISHEKPVVTKDFIKSESKYQQITMKDESVSPNKVDDQNKS